MEKSEISIQVEPGTEGIRIIPRKSISEREAAICISSTGKIMIIDPQRAIEMIDEYGVNCKSDMLGKTAFIIIYDATKEVLTDQGTYLVGDCLIMKNDHGLKGMTEEEITGAIIEYKSHLVGLRMGPFSFTGYEIS